MAAFLEALETEIRLRAPASPVGLRSLYLGGGTPSLLPAAAITRLTRLVGEVFGLSADAEVTVEANPGREERGDPSALREAGVTRISYGAQSLDDGELRRLGRRHRARDVAAAVLEARQAGVASINLDLLYDIPGQSLASWTAALEEALSLEPDHLSLYALTLDDPDAEGLTGPGGDHLPTTAGARRWRGRARPGQDQDRAAAMYGHAMVRLAEAGYRSYEISNWARPGHECRHNLGYWQRRPIEAVGPGAHAFDGAVRRWNAARLDGYLAALVPPDGSSPRLPPGGEERLEARTELAEQAILGLRLAEGIDQLLADAPTVAPAVAWAREAGLAERTAQGRVRLTARGRLLSNEVFARLV